MNRLTTIVVGDSTSAKLRPMPDAEERPSSLKAVRIFCLVFATLVWLAYFAARSMAAHAATLPATPATLALAVAAAHDGDVIAEACGAYGDFTERKPNLTFQGSLCVVFNTLSVISPAHDVAFDGFNAAMVFAPGKTTTSSAVVRASSVANVSFKNCRVSGPIATTGVPQTATAFDMTGNVIGLPTGRGIVLDFAPGATVENCDISRVMRGITLAQGLHVKIAGNHIHDTRGALIDGGVVDDVQVTDNVLETAKPFRWGLAEPKDHSDFIHFWTGAGSGLAGSNILVARNLLDQGTGANILGQLYEDNSGLGWVNLRVIGNTGIGGNSQGISVGHMVSGEISGNTLLTLSGNPVHNAESIYLHGSQPAAVILKNNTAADLYHVLARQPAANGNTILPTALQAPAAIAAARAKALAAMIRTPTPGLALAPRSLP